MHRSQCTQVVVNHVLTVAWSVFSDQEFENTTHLFAKLQP